ncbi:MAG: hypothetical protein HOP28_16945, partial [Gemmatimonadales bacterium]|nr:hypothetical protein [Gemmatimonadales bacterium]
MTLRTRVARLTLLLLAVQMVGFPAEAFVRFLPAPTLERQCIIKNLVVVSAAAVVGATVRGR